MRPLRKSRSRTRGIEKVEQHGLGSVRQFTHFIEKAHHKEEFPNSRHSPAELHPEKSLQSRIGHARTVDQKQTADSGGDCRRESLQPELFSHSFSPLIITLASVAATILIVCSSRRNSGLPPTRSVVTWFISICSFIHRTRRFDGTQIQQLRVQKSVNNPKTMIANPTTVLGGGACNLYSLPASSPVARTAGNVPNPNANIYNAPSSQLPGWRSTVTSYKPIHRSQPQTRPYPKARSNVFTGIKCRPRGSSFLHSGTPIRSTFVNLGNQPEM